MNLWTVMHQIFHLWHTFVTSRNKNIHDSWPWSRGNSNNSTKTSSQLTTTACHFDGFDQKTYLPAVLIHIFTFIRFPSNFFVSHHTPVCYFASTIAWSEARIACSTSITSTVVHTMLLVPRPIWEMGRHPKHKLHMHS